MSYLRELGPDMNIAVLIKYQNSEICLVCLKEKYLGELKSLQLSVIMQCIPRYVLWIELCAPKRYLESYFQYRSLETRSLQT